MSVSEGVEGRVTHGSLTHWHSERGGSSNTQSTLHHHTCGSSHLWSEPTAAHSSVRPGSPRSLTHLERCLQQLVYPGDLLTERTVLLQEHRRRSPRFGEVGTDKRIRVVQVLDPARHGGHVRATASSRQLTAWRRAGVLYPAWRIQLLCCCRTIRCCSVFAAAAARYVLTLAAVRR